MVGEYKAPGHSELSCIACAAENRDKGLGNPKGSYQQVMKKFPEVA